MPYPSNQNYDGNSQWMKQTRHASPSVHGHAGVPPVATPGMTPDGNYGGIPHGHYYNSANMIPNNNHNYIYNGHHHNQSAPNLQYQEQHFDFGRTPVQQHHQSLPQPHYNYNSYQGGYQHPQQSNRVDPYTPPYDYSQYAKGSSTPGVPTGVSTGVPGVPAGVNPGIPAGVTPGVSPQEPPKSHELPAIPPKKWSRASSAAYVPASRTGSGTKPLSVQTSFNANAVSTTTPFTPMSAPTPDTEVPSSSVPVSPIGNHNEEFPPIPPAHKSPKHRRSTSTGASGTRPQVEKPDRNSAKIAASTDRATRMAKIYGRNNEGLPLPSSRDPSPPYTQQSPLHIQRSRPISNGSSYHNVGTSLSQSALNLSNHAQRNPQTQFPNPASSSTTSKFDKLAKLDTSKRDSKTGSKLDLSSGGVSMPTSAASSKFPFDTNLEAPPLPPSQSEPSSPLMPPASFESSPPRRGTPSRFGRLFGLRSKADLHDSNSAPGSPKASSEANSPASSRANSRSSFASRMSSRISSRISLNAESRLGNLFSSGANPSAAASTTSLLDLSGSSEPKELSNDWIDFSPRRPPQPSVVEDFRNYGTPEIPLFDIEPSLENSFPMAVNPLNPEMRQFTNRGIFYYGDEAEGKQIGETDDEGNYKSQKGEQLGFRYNVVDELGRGSFGTVLRCRDHRTGRMVAVKVTANRQEVQGQARIEAKMLRALLVDHKGEPGKHHFLRYIEHFTLKDHLCIATELLGVNLFEMCKRNQFRGLREPTVQYITRQLLEGLEFLADQHVIHCDMKPENILVSDPEKCQVKIVDFGSGCYERNRLYTYIQSRFYRAPEILLGMPYGPPIDMWSLGAIIPELLMGRPLFHSVDEVDQIALMSQVIGSPDPQSLFKCRRGPLFFDIDGMPLQLTNSKGVTRKHPGSTPLSHLLRHCSPEAIDFCSQILKWDPEKRLTAAKAIYHPFVISQ